ncbi:MAG: c-type cytochrome [Vicinamibacterales bacterium]
MVIVGAALWALSAVLSGVSAQAPAGRTVWDGVYTEEQAKRGSELYTKACASCHSESLTGLESAPPLTGEQFNGNWSGTTLGELAERIRISMPADMPGSLSRPQLGDLLAHLLKVDGFPAGTTPLDPQAVALAQIRFESVRPAPR